MARTSTLEIIPLGGLGEFGMNMMVYRIGRDCLLVDTGMMFPGAEHLGVDVVIPNMDFLSECGTIHGIVLTHGHEDHIGALPYVLARHDVPVWCSRYTGHLVKARLKEHSGNQAAIRSFPEENEALTIGPFTVETVPVAHSIPQACMLAIHTELGTVVHTADFKLDPSPPGGEGTDLRRLSELGDRGVLALLSDSTNAMVPGTTPGELSVRPALDSLIGQADRRVLVASFASNIQRIRQLTELASRHGRKIALVGSSLISHTDIARSLGLLSFPAGSRMMPADLMNLPPEKALLVVTGSQGEPMSALSRIAVHNHKDVSIEEGDLLIHSARVIPGNEKSISRLFNHLLRRGARLVTGRDAAVHVSGHPAQEELKLIQQLLRPRFFIPIHGEYGQLSAHAALAAEMGIPHERIVLAESGDLIALDGTTCQVVDRVPAGQVFIDAALGKVDLSVLKDRRKIAGDGIVVAVISLDRDSGEVRKPTEFVSRGFLAEDEQDGIMDLAAAVVRDTISEATHEERIDEALLRAKLLSDLKRFFRKKTQRRPMIIPVLVEF
ncbi:MAG: ribonuclease J [Acidobacteria bacterium]|uniref:Ribonuclease J n=1 Tax=Candidatus Polarisedimenticola svalbardensis TaxID=2886004 RepID=A0A8J6XTV8_9BACT|nr:ribonuclease J [Candidatus Polarisedimenticola svalbardensis]